ncbi:MAG TPA: sodium:calcium antiporter [Candidatus Dojkabacteria bacterium]|nr:sodium:calcium antiporter [Candidatus Dojkabacteria bacterium]
MDILPTIGSLLVLIFLLVKSADLIESSFVGISRRLGVNTFLIGFVILAMTSSLPETFVAINAASSGYSGLSVGNIVGATIILLTLVIGISAIKNKSLPFKGMYSTKEVLFSLAIIYAQILVLIDGRMDWMEGIFLLALYSGFVVYIIAKSKVWEITNNHSNRKLSTLLIKSILGIAGLILSANLTVSTALGLAEALNTPPLIIGLLVLGIGTNLPEIVIMLRSKNGDMGKLAAGNFIGSATFNSAVLGLLILIRPTTLVNFTSLIPALILLSITIFMFSLMVINDRTITRKEGYILLFIYAVYITSELILNF